MYFRELIINIMEEYLPLINEKGEVIGKELRSVCHGGSFLLHPVVHLHVFNSKGELYLQKRSANKKLLPLKWDTAVGGHVDYGETIMEALLRETREELGIVGAEIHPMFTYPFRSQTEYEMVNAFYTIYDGVITPDKDEIAEGRFFTIEELNNLLTSPDLTPNFKQEFPKVLEALPFLTDNTNMTKR